MSLGKEWIPHQDKGKCFVGNVTEQNGNAVFFFLELRMESVESYKSFTFWRDNLRALIKFVTFQTTIPLLLTGHEKEDGSCKIRTREVFKKKMGCEFEPRQIHYFRSTLLTNDSKIVVINYSETLINNAHSNNKFKKLCTSRKKERFEVGI